MNCRSSIVAPAVLLALACAAAAQPYDIKIKREAEPGKSVICRDSTKGTGVLKKLDLNGQLLDEKPGSSTEAVYAETVLEGDKNGWTRLKRVYDKATEKGGGDAKPKSYQGRTIVLERKDGKVRVGVVGDKQVDAADLARLQEDAEKVSSRQALLMHLAPAKPVKVGDSWKIDMKTFAASVNTIQVDPERSSIEVKLVKVVTRDKTLFGVFEVKISEATAGIKGKFTLDPPAVESGTETLEIAIDGSSTEYTLESKTAIAEKSKMLVGNRPVLRIEMDLKNEGRVERSAEKDDPKARAAPEVAYWSDRPPWAGFASREDRFSLDFPGKPREEVTKDENAASVTRTLSVDLDKGVAYKLSCETHADTYNETEAKQILDDLAKSLEKTTKSKKDISLNGFPGLEIVYVVKKPDGDLYAVQRVFVVKNRIYQVLALAGEARKDKLEAERFFKSFKIEDRMDQ